MKTCLLFALLVSTFVWGETPAPQYIASGKLMIQWPVNSNSGAFEESGRAEFCNTLIKVMESKELRYRALERVRGLHPELKEVAVETKTVRVKDTAILEVTSTGGAATYVKIYLDALLDETLAFYREVAEKAVNPVAYKIIEQVFTREKEMRRNVKEKHDFLKAHPKDLESPENQEKLKNLEAERKRLDEEYQPWLKSFQKIDQYLETSAPGVAVMERPQAAVVKP